MGMGRRGEGVGYQAAVLREPVLQGCNLRPLLRQLLLQHVGGLDMCGPACRKGVPGFGLGLSLGIELGSPSWDPLRSQSVYTSG